jgi:hypothetical protein
MKRLLHILCLFFQLFQINQAIFLLNQLNKTINNENNSDIIENSLSYSNRINEKIFKRDLSYGNFLNKFGKKCLDSIDLFII